MKPRKRRLIIFELETEVCAAGCGNGVKWNVLMLLKGNVLRKSQNVGVMVAYMGYERVINKKFC